MRIVVCAKQVRDPDAVNNYALEGKLEIGEDGKTLTQASIPRLMNAYDEQAIEAALRTRDAGLDCSLTVVAAAADCSDMLKHAAAMGADDIVQIPIDLDAADYHTIGALLAAYIGSSGGADLVLCGRQASDDDQGVVPALVAEALAMPLITIARSVQMADGNAVRVVRVTPDGEQTVEASLPAVVTISNELGDARYPTMQGKMKARKKEITVVETGSLGLAETDLAARVKMTKQFVPTVKGECEMLEGGSAADIAGDLVARLRADNVL